jgi:hypothetical protein
MTTVLLIIIGAAVAYVMYRIGSITVAQLADWRGDERVAGRLVDQPTVDDVGKPAKGMGL